MKLVKANFTIEAAILVPLLLSLIVTCITGVFYFHDKNVIQMIAQETLLQECDVSQEEVGRVEIEFQKKIRGKLLLFCWINAKAKWDSEKIILNCNGKKQGMSVKIQAQIEQTKPETTIRRIKILEKLGEIGVEK